MMCRFIELEHSKSKMEIYCYLHIQPTLPNQLWKGKCIFCCGFPKGGVNQFLCRKEVYTEPIRTYRGAEPPEAQLQRPPPDRRLPACEVGAEAACRLRVLRLHGHPRGRGDRSSRRGQRRQRSAGYVAGWWLLIPRGEIISLDFEFATPD